MSLKMSFEFSKLRSVTILTFSNNHNNHDHHHNHDNNNYRWLQGVQNW